MSVDIDRLIVDVGQGVYRLGEGIGGWSVTGSDVGVIALPVFKFVPENGEFLLDFPLDLDSRVCGLLGVLHCTVVVVVF